MRHRDDYYERDWRLWAIRFMRPAVAVLFAAVVLGLILCLYFLSTPALSHSFYPASCCSGADCAPLDAKRVQVTPSGYVIDGRETIPHNKVLFSPDEHYHGCFPPSMMGKVGCFWAPQRAY